MCFDRHLSICVNSVPKEEFCTCIVCLRSPACYLIFELLLMVSNRYSQTRATQDLWVLVLRFGMIQWRRDEETDSWRTWLPWNEGEEHTRKTHSRLEFGVWNQIWNTSRLWIVLKSIASVHSIACIEQCNAFDKRYRQEWSYSQTKELRQTWSSKEHTDFRLRTATLRSYNIADRPVISGCIVPQRVPRKQYDARS